MRSTNTLGGILFSLLVVTSSQALADDATPGPDALFGEWRGDCDAWGTDAHCELDWESGLHTDQFTVRYAILNANTGDGIFLGAGVYRQAENHIDGYWSDSSDAIHPLSASWDGAALTTHWGTVGSAQGRTVYRLNEDGSLRVIDWALSDEGWRQFMDVVYGRGAD